MRRLSITLALAVTCSLLAGIGAAGAASGDYIVMLRDGVSLQAHLKALKITPNRVYQYASTGFEAVLNGTQYQRELNSSDVSSITHNSSVPVDLEPVSKTSTPTQPPQFVTRGIRRIGGLDSPTAAIDGVDTRVNVDVAVVDSGVDAAHPDLNVAGGVDCSGNNGAFRDKLGHGTMVSGFIGAIDNAIGAVGVAPGVRIWSVQVFNNQGVITEGALLCAVDWITAHASTIEIANMSLGGPLPLKQETENCGIAPKNVNSDPLHAAICGSVAAGVTYVVSAGNDTVDTAGVTPASYDEVITASALADSDGTPGGVGPPLPDSATCANTFPHRYTLMFPDDSLALFSNFGADVDLAAPGVCISSTYPGGSYAVGTGTSFASPLVAGAAALYISNHPGATPAQVRAALISLEEPGPISGDPDTSPEGVLNVSSL